MKGNFLKGYIEIGETFTKEEITVWGLPKELFEKVKELYPDEIKKIDVTVGRTPWDIKEPEGKSCYLLKINAGPIVISLESDWF
jgi:hypothetical protein